VRNRGPQTQHLGDTVYIHLRSVGQKDGRGQVAGDAAEHVDDGNPQPASQLLDVPQHRHLEKHRHQAVQDPADTEKNHRHLTIHRLDGRSGSISASLSRRRFGHRGPSVTRRREVPVTPHGGRATARGGRTGLGSPG